MGLVALLRVISRKIESRFIKLYIKYVIIIIKRRRGKRKIYGILGWEYEYVQGDFRNVFLKNFDLDISHRFPQI